MVDGRVNRLSAASRLQDTPSPRTVWLVSCLALLACVVARMTHLLGLPIFTDEMAYVRAGQAVARGQSLLAELHYGHPPLFSWMEAVVTHLTVASPLLAGRLTGALCGFITCLTVMLSAAEFGMSWLISLSGLAYALCPYTVIWDRMALLDGPLSMWGALALYWTLRAYAAATDRQLTVRLVILGITIGCGMYAKTEALAFNILPVMLALCGPRTDLSACAGSSATGWPRPVYDGPVAAIAREH
jgi:4-amino-4-deoxy-L-arabinose transferase-like glycosyltransferase